MNLLLYCFPVFDCLSVHVHFRKEGKLWNQMWDVWNVKHDVVKPCGRRALRMFLCFETAWRSTYLCLCVQYFWQALADTVKHTVCVWTWSDIPLVWSPTSIFGMISHVRKKGSFRTSLCSSVTSQYIQMDNVGKSSFMYWVHMHVVLCYRWRQIGWF